MTANDSLPASRIGRLMAILKEFQEATPERQEQVLEYLRSTDQQRRQQEARQ